MSSSRFISRTIPTWVGRTYLQSGRYVAGSDHPHVGGENCVRSSDRVSTRGPSPRGWGEPHALVDGLAPVRTIPTWVGRTWCQRSCKLLGADHPHVGGENFPNDDAAGLEFGPSPRGWGEPLVI